MTRPAPDHPRSDPSSRRRRLPRWNGPLGTARTPWHVHKVRWNEDKSRRFQVLRAAEAQRLLTDAERSELDQLLADLDADEADALRPAMAWAQGRLDHLAAEKARLDAQAEALARIVTEHERMLAPLSR